VAALGRVPVSIPFRHVPAGLNFSSPMAYAVAKAHDVPLLFKGDDFSRTDVRRPHA